MSINAGHATILPMDMDVKSVCTLHRAREALKDVTPLLRDCGGLCGRACCQPDTEGRGGMLLFPEEETFYADMPEGFALQRDFSLGGEELLLVCRGVCDREQRPLACRIFPLTFGEKEGRPAVFLDPRAWPLCPLMPSGMEGLSDRFTDAARRAADTLWEDSVFRAFIIRQQAYIRRFSKAIWADGGIK